MNALIFFIVTFFIFFILCVIVCESLSNQPASLSKQAEINRLIKDHPDDFEDYLIRNGLYETYLKMYKV